MPATTRVALIALALLLSACSSRAPSPQPGYTPPVSSSSYQGGAEDVLFRALGLVGTPYRWGGNTPDSGFDCSGFIGYLFKEELGMQLPRSSRDMINIDAPLVSRDDLEPGDLLFFSTSGRNRVSHAGIYMGDNQFIHSSSSRSGGVRVDSLDDRYWSRTFIEAKRALALAPSESVVRHP